MELIDRNEFAKILYLNVRNDNLRIYAEVCNILKDMPTVDAVPVVHGHWTKKQNPQWKGYSHDCCSVCGWWNTKNALCRDEIKIGHSLNYCPHCGAKMNEERRTE